VIDNEIAMFQQQPRKKMNRTRAIISRVVDEAASPDFFNAIRTRSLVHYKKILRAILAVSALFMVAGCSSGYHTDYCGCVPYRYYAPCPLPYSDYQGCETPHASRTRQALNVSSDDYVHNGGNRQNSLDGVAPF